MICIFVFSTVLKVSSSFKSHLFKPLIVFDTFTVGFLSDLVVNLRTVFLVLRVTSSVPPLEITAILDAPAANVSFNLITKEGKSAQLTVETIRRKLP